MKKQGSLILLILMLVFGSFSLGFFTGRNSTRSTVQVSARPQTTTAATQATAAQVVSVTVPTGTLPAATVPETTAETAPAETETEQTVPETTVPEELPETTVPETTAGGLVNINTAEQAALMTLPGIGEVISQRIVEYREENGPFHSAEELINIKGIGEKRLEALLPLVTVGG